MTFYKFYLEEFHKQRHVVCFVKEMFVGRWRGRELGASCWGESFVAVSWQERADNTTAGDETESVGDGFVVWKVGNIWRKAESQVTTVMGQTMHSVSRNLMLPGIEWRSIFPIKFPTLYSRLLTSSKLRVSGNSLLFLLEPILVNSSELDLLLQWDNSSRVKLPNSS